MTQIRLFVPFIDEVLCFLGRRREELLVISPITRQRVKERSKHGACHGGSLGPHQLRGARRGAWPRGREVEVDAQPGGCLARARQPRARPAGPGTHALLGLLGFAATWLGKHAFPRFLSSVSVSRTRRRSQPPTIKTFLPQRHKS